MKKIYVCSPLRGDMEKNMELARKYSKYVIKQGYLPITPHIYFTQLLDDNKPKDRDKGIALGFELLEMCDELWVFGDRISSGMRYEIGYFKKDIKICSLKN